MNEDRVTRLGILRGKRLEPPEFEGLKRSIRELCRRLVELDASFAHFIHVEDKEFGPLQVGLFEENQRIPRTVVVFVDGRVCFISSLEVGLYCADDASDVASRLINLIHVIAQHRIFRSEGISAFMAELSIKTLLSYGDADQSRVGT